MIPLTDEEIALANGNNRIAAIKAYRLRTGISLRDAKDHLETQLYGGCVVYCPVCGGKGQVVHHEMTETDRLLALDAALTACEGLLPSNLGDLLKHLSTKFENNPELGEFGQFLEAQKLAVRKLVTNPQVFGG